MIKNGDPKCSKCGGTGLLPLILPNGTKSNHAEVFCECHRTYGDNAFQTFPLTTEGRRPGSGSKKLPRTIPRGRRHLYIDDFDFPVSYDFYRSLCQEHGWHDPGSDYPAPVEQQEPQEMVHRYVYEREAKRDVRKQTIPTRQRGMTIE